MLIEFNVGNFRSLRDRTRFSMLATRLVARNKQIDTDNVFSVDDLKLLRSAVIYGPNASGKSNFVSALTFVAQFVVNSSKATQAGDPIPTDPFELREDLHSEPSFFEIVCWIEDRVIRYGFEVDQDQVLSEWLFHTPKEREVRLFIRERDKITVSRTFREGRGLEDKTRSNALFLSVVAQFNGAISGSVLRWFRRLIIVSGVHDYSYLGKTVAKLNDARFAAAVKEFVRDLDLGIADITVDGLGDRKDGLDDEDEDRDMHRIVTVHKTFDKTGAVTGERLFDLYSHESEGTQKLFALSGPVVDALSNGRPLVVDELDARLHPVLTLAIVRLFNSSKTNPRNAQLIFTTHDTNLLNADLFRRDQVWFAEKDSQGGTELYSLAEFRVRNDASFEKDYIQGRFGAVPFLGDLNAIMAGDA